MHSQGRPVPGEILLLGMDDQIRVPIGGQDAVVHVGVVPQQRRMILYALVGVVGVNP